MPLKKTDAERMLRLLWEFRSIADENEEWSGDCAAFRKAISMLHAYLTDVLPATQRQVKIHLAQRTIEVTIAPQLDLQWVEMDCKANRELGIQLQSLDGLVRAQDNFCPVYISGMERASVAEREGVLKRGDIVVEVNQRSLMHVSLDQARSVSVCFFFPLVILSPVAALRVPLRILYRVQTLHAPQVNSRCASV